MNIFSYTDYKAYILAVIAAEPARGRGFRKKLAEAAKCQLAYISHVLNGNYHFSLEHGEAISQLLAHNENEMEYFLLLIQFARAGTPRLSSFFKRQILEKQGKESKLKNRVKIESSLNLEDQTTYYSSWLYPAVHMALTIPALQSPSKIARYFNLELREIKLVLDFLTQKGLVGFANSLYRPVGNFLHLENESPMIISHHTQWRQLALKDISLKRPDSLHYSSCFSVADKDVPKLKSLLSKFLEEATLVIKPSAEERLFGLGLDLFEI